ncbi:ATP-binding protein [Streptomyces sp. WMMB 322]|uniref:sensor histidine kinase n=1 Tax=Streptomyces sp. WMMB 322 TaxID=1286821 RepID=UPI0008239513|nr:ATP-binding protein [Streptomyces sp. WMMB 322]SCK36813.1 Signal transduction histidine kinase [Streptomyces sp. WMMB 322]
MPEPPSHAVQSGRGAPGPAHASGPRAGNAPLPVATPGSDGATLHVGPGAPGAAAASGSRRRHGRSPAPLTQGDTALRHSMVRLAVLPAVIVAVAGAAVVAYVMSVEGSTGASGSPAQGADGAVLWSILGAALLLVCGVVFGAAHFATAQSRDALERHTVLRRSVARGRSEIRALLSALERGERPSAGLRPLPPQPAPNAEAFELLTYELAHAQHAAERAVTDAVALVRSNSSGSEEKVEVFVNLARRLQSLVHREIELLDELENEVEDPDLLKGLFHVDHLATRIRRHAENLAVLGGAVSRRQWSRPVTMTEVLRSSIAEVEHYPRVKLVPPIEGTLRGHAVADVIHLLAELVENATVFSAPQTQVLLRAQHVTAGLAIEVEDRGLGMPVAEQDRMNAVLSDPDRIDVGELLQDGRIGLFVVSALAQRHGIVVQLQSNIYGGIQAVLVLPREVLGDEPAAGEQSGAAHGARAHGTAEANGATSDTAPLPPARTESTEHPHERPPSPPGTPGAAPPGARRPAEPGRLPYEPGPQSPAHSYSGRQPLPQPERSPSASPSPSASSSSAAGQGAQPRFQARPQRSGPAGGAAANSDRPELPRRRRQEHLVPELREAPADRGGRAEAEWDAAAQGHNPGLMAAFQRGTSLAEEAGRGTDSTGRGAPHPAG